MLHNYAVARDFEHPDPAGEIVSLVTQHNSSRARLPNA